MNGPVNMHDIAKRAKVSIGTVSNVLNGTVAVREPLRLRVLEAIKAFGYQRSQLARGLRRNYTNMIGMIVPDITNPFFPSLVRAAEDVAYTHKYRLVLCNSDNDSQKEASYLTELQSYLPAGLLLIPAIDSLLREQPMRNGRPTPTVCIDRKPEGWKCDTIYAGNENGAYAATLHLIDHGHRRIAVIGGPSHLANARQRLRGFRQALKEAGIPLPDAYVQTGRFDRASGIEAALCLLRPASRPTAIFAANDLMAMGAMLGMRELGLRCPEDVSLVGFDNLVDIVDLLQPPLTTVQQPVYRLGVTAAELLLERISGANDAPKEIVLETELIRRGSVMRARPLDLTPSPDWELKASEQQSAGARKRSSRPVSAQRTFQPDVG
jgi:DNA-binding LacI/PurR family transcriptional regulator